LAVARVLSVRTSRRLGRFLGTVYGWTHPQARAAVRANLALVSDAAASNSTVMRTFGNFGATLADYFQLGVLAQPEADKFVEAKSGLHNIRQALEAGKGALLVTVHVGLFELGGLITEDYRLPLVVLSLPEPDPDLNRWRAAYRQRWGAETLCVGTDEFSFVGIMRQLGQNKCVAMLVDRPHRPEDAVPVDFPHGPVPFSMGPAWLSLLTGAPVVPTTIVAAPSGNYIVEAQTPLYPQGRGPDRATAARELTIEIAGRFRRIICQHPDQWYQFVPLSQSPG
jgi:KDO2-lipid IV(A) lauroyltransferase